MMSRSMIEFFKQAKTALLLLVMLTMLTGLLYPLLITGIAKIVFPVQADGSLLEYQGKKIGSKLIGQAFTGPQYFWGRPSATEPYPYNAKSSAGSNQGPMNSNYLTIVKERIKQLSATEHNKQLIPVDLVTASASGLDPEISPLAAYYQVPRIAKVRHLPEEKINTLISQHIQNRTFLILGEPRVNVLALNLALDNLEGQHATIKTT